MEEKKYVEERFEFALYVNNNVICKRNFKINNFIEGSMNTVEFKEKVDEIVHLIDCDLKSKSRVWTWYNFNPEFPDANKDAMEELSSPLLEPWECTFKFVISDNRKPVIMKIWDGYAYPKQVRDKVDLANKTVKIIGDDGNVLTYDKETFFEKNDGRLPAELGVIRAMIMDKQDVLLAITKKICETCSPREKGFKGIGDYDTVESYGNDSITVKNGATNKRKKYHFDMNVYNNVIASAWGKALAKKTKEYFSNLY